MTELKGSCFWLTFDRKYIIYDFKPNSWYNKLRKYPVAHFGEKKKLWKTPFILQKNTHGTRCQTTYFRCIYVWPIIKALVNTFCNKVGLFGKGVSCPAAIQRLVLSVATGALRWLMATGLCRLRYPPLWMAIVLIFLVHHPLVYKSFTRPSEPKRNEHFVLAGT